MASSSYLSNSNSDAQISSLIIEGFICPECQQDMSSIELLQAHFQLVHSNSNKNYQSNNSQNNNLTSNSSALSSNGKFSSMKSKSNLNI